MENGVSTVNLTSSSLIDTLVGSYAGSTRKITLTRLVALINSLLGPTYATRAELYADLTWPDGAIGYVRGDATSAYNGVYTKQGGSGAGSWTRTGDLPTSAVEAAQINALANAVTDLGEDLHTRRVATTWNVSFSSVTFPAGTDVVIVRNTDAFEVWVSLSVAPSPVVVGTHQQDAVGAWWQKTFDKADIDASLTDLGADLHNRRVVATAGNNFSAVTWPEGTTTVLQRDGSSFRVWRLYTNAVPTPVDATHYQQDATGAWWHKVFDMAEVMTAIAAEAERAGAAEGIIAGNLTNEVNRATAAEGVIAGNLTTEINRAIAAENALSADLHTRRVATTWNVSFSSVTFPAGTDVVIVRNTDAFEVWVSLSVAPSPVVVGTHQQDAVGGWWQKTFDKADIDASLTDLGADLHNRRVVATAGNNFSAVTWPEGTTTVLQRDGSSFRVWRLYTDVVPTPVDATHYQQDATGAWWHKAFDLAEVMTAIAAEAERAGAAEGVISASLTALGADLHTRRVVATAGNAFSAVTWPEGTTTVLQRDGSSFRVWRLYTDVVPTPVDATHYQQDATGAWWHKAFDLAEVMTAIAAEAERAGAAEGVIAGNLVNEVNRATAAEGVIAGNLANEVNRATAAEGVIAGNLANEVNRATAAEGVIAGNLANEVNRATVADARLARAAGGAHSYSVDVLDDEAAIRIDFASGECFIKAVDGDTARDPSEFAAVSSVTQLVKNRSGLLRRSVSGALRRSVAADGASGAVFEPQATVWGSDNVLGAGVTVSGITVAADSSVPAVEGTTPKALTATAGGTVARYFGYAAIPMTVGWYQVDMIVARQDARYMIFRLPAEAGSTSFSGGGYVFCMDLETRTFTNTYTSTVTDADGPFFYDLPGGLIRIHFRFWAFSAYAAGHPVYVYPKNTLDTTLTSTFAAGTALGVIHHFSVQKCAAPRLPAAPVGNGISIAADKAEIDVSALIQDPLSWSFECHFRLAPGFRETDDGVVPIFKVSVDPDAANRGVGIEMVGRAITAVLGSTSVPKTISIEDVYSDSYRVAMAYDGETLRLAVNGLTASATVNSISNLYTQMKRLRFGDYLPILDGTLRPFSGVIAFWRYVPRALSQDEMIAATTGSQQIIPGAAVPVLADGTGQAVLSLAGDGSLDFKPGRAAARYLLSGAYWADALPADAMAVTPRANGDVDYLTDAWGGRTHRVRQSAEGWGIFYRADGQVDILWGSGQSLAYGNVYTDPVVSPDTPGFLDVDDGNPSSVFGYSATGYYNDRLTYPWISAANGGGGNVYPAAKMLAALRAEDDHTPLPLIAKTIGQSGARISALWPWGVYSTDPWDEDGNWIEDTPVTNPAIFPDTHWLNVRRWHKSVKDACARLGFVPVVKSFTWVQGTADKTNLHYFDDLELSRADFRKLTREFYGEQEADPLWVLTQSGGDTNTSTIVWPVCDAQLRYCEETPRTVLGAPLYQPDIVLQDGQVHPNYHSTTIFGELLGIATHETLNGRKWTIGTPEITVAADHLILDYSKWLRDDELLTIAADTYYGGIGIDVGKGVQIVDVINTGSFSGSRTGTATPVTGVEVVNGGTAYKVAFSGTIQQTQGFQVRYALQQQDVTTADPLHYAHRGLLRTTWERRSFALPDRVLHRWLPSFRKEFLL